LPGEAWSSYLSADSGVISDWVKLKCGHYDTVKKKCTAGN